MNRNIFLILIFAILLSNFALAQQIETTVNDPNQLRAIFEFRQENQGPIHLYKTIRGRELSIGSLQGIIRAEPPSIVTTRNGIYESKNENGGIIIANGDIVLQKIPNKNYPLLKLFNGTITASNTIFSCSRGCDFIEADLNTGQMRLYGNANMTRKNINNIDYIFEIRNIQFEPLTVSNIKIFNINIIVPESGDELSSVHYILLAPGSNGNYLYGIKKRNNPADEFLIDFFLGNFHILDIKNPQIQVLAKRGNDMPRLDYFGQNLLEVNNRFIHYVNRRDYFNRICAVYSSTASCVLFEPEFNEVKASLKKGTAITLNLDNNAISMIDLTSFGADDNRGRLVAKKDSLGNRKIIFKKDDIIIDGAWTDFGISFKAYIYRQQSRTYDQIECRYNGADPSQSKCYLNGIETILGSSARNIHGCNNNNECVRGYVCQSNRCIESRGCKLINEGLYRDPISVNNIDLLFIGEGLSSYDEVEQITNKMIYGADSLFETEPFKSNKNKFNIWVMPSPPIRITQLTNEEIDFIDASNCPNADVKILLSDRNFRSYAEGTMSNTCIISIANTDFENKRTLTHEFGHCFGDLWDEYSRYVPGKAGKAGTPNCIAPKSGKSAEQIAQQEWTRLLSLQNIPQEDAQQEAWVLVEQAKQNFRGCGGDCNNRCNNYLRPSANSIMNTHWILTSEAGEFNKISTIYLQDKITRNTIIS